MLLYLSIVFNPYKIYQLQVINVKIIIIYLVMSFKTEVSGHQLTGDNPNFEQITSKLSQLYCDAQTPYMISVKKLSVAYAILVISLGTYQTIENSVLKIHQDIFDEFKEDFEWLQKGNQPVQGKLRKYFDKIHTNINAIESITAKSSKNMLQRQLKQIHVNFHEVINGKIKSSSHNCRNWTQNVLIMQTKDEFLIIGFTTSMQNIIAQKSSRKIDSQLIVSVVLLIVLICVSFELWGDYKVIDWIAINLHKNSWLQSIIKSK